MRKTGLHRIVSAPEQREYLQAQFLGDAPPTVPPVLTSELRRPLPDSGNESHGRA